MGESKDISLTLQVPNELSSWAVTTAKNDVLDVISPTDFKTAKNETLKLTSNFIPPRVPDSRSHADNSRYLPPLERAIEQVQALMDLYSNNTNHRDSISGELVLTAVESLINRQRSNMLHTAANTLCRLEDLVWRLRDLDLHPSRWLLEEVWNLQQLEAQELLSRVQQPDLCFGRDLLVERQAKLLSYWIQWSLQAVQPEITDIDSGLRPPPPQYVMSTFQLAIRTMASVSRPLLELYTRLHSVFGMSKNRKDCNKTMYLSREFYSTVLRRVVVAPSNEFSPCRVLQDMERYYQATGRSLYKPTVHELQDALEVAARQGILTDAGWLFQMLMMSWDDDNEGRRDMDEHGIDIDRVGYWRWLLLESISHSTSIATNVTAAALYAQRLVTCWHEWPQSSSSGTIILPCRDHYHQLLRMWASSRRTGAGVTAEGIFVQWIDNTNSTSSRPLSVIPDAFFSSPLLLQQRQSQDESIHLVVKAFLLELPRCIQNVIKADRFIRQVIVKRQRKTPRHCRQNHATPEKKSLSREPSKSSVVYFPTIEAILAAYHDYGRTEPIIAITHALRLFQFLLIQHRDGRTSEEPNPTHFKYVLGLIKDNTEHHAGDEVCVELFRLVSTLADQNVLSQGPDAECTCQLLNIMADSGKSGYGSYAREIFQTRLSQYRDDLPKDQMQKAAAHVAQCVRLDSSRC